MVDDWERVDNEVLSMDVGEVEIAMDSGDVNGAARFDSGALIGTNIVVVVEIKALAAFVF